MEPRIPGRIFESWPESPLNRLKVTGEPGGKFLCHFLFCFSFFLSFFLLIVFKLQKKYGRSEPGENLVKSPKSVKKRIVKESSKNRQRIGTEWKSNTRRGTGWLWVVVGGCGWVVEGG